MDVKESVKTIFCLQGDSCLTLLPTQSGQTAKMQRESLSTSLGLMSCKWDENSLRQMACPGFKGNGFEFSEEENPSRELS